MKDLVADFKRMLATTATTDALTATNQDTGAMNVSSGPETA